MLGASKWYTVLIFIVCDLNIWALLNQVQEEFLISWLILT